MSTLDAAVGPTGTGTPGKVVHIFLTHGLYVIIQLSSASGQGRTFTEISQWSHYKGHGNGGFR